MRKMARKYVFFLFFVAVFFGGLTFSAVRRIPKFFTEEKSRGWEKNDPQRTFFICKIAFF
jgi:hypothetical protein